MSKKTLTIVIILSLALVVGVAIGVFLYMNGSNGEKVKEIPTYTVGADDLYSNIKDSKKMLKINIVVETSSEELKENMENKKFLIRDTTNEIVVGKTEEDLLGENGQTNLKKEILKSLVEVFENERITNIYFNDFIIQ